MSDAAAAHVAWKAVTDAVKARYAHVGSSSSTSGDGSGVGSSSSRSGSGSSSSNSMGCEFCTMAVEYVKMALHNNETEAQIEEVRKKGS